MGGSKKQTIGYRYYLGMHMVLCHGPIDYIHKIIVGEKTAWWGLSSGGQIQIRAGSLFGGDEKEGGISGTVDIEMGNPDQPKNSYLMSVLGSIIPAYRGVVGVVVRKAYLGTSPYLKPWAFLATRIYKTSDGADQWYPEKAAIHKPESELPETVNYELTDYFPGFLEGGSGAPVVGEDNPGTLVIGPFPEPRDIQSVSARCGHRFVFNGVVYGGIGEDGFTYPVGHSFLFLPAGQTLTVKIRKTLPTGGSFAFGFIRAVAIPDMTPDMNPAHIIRECLTNSDWGQGYGESDIDDDNFRAVADTLHEEGLGISLIWDRSMSIENFIEEVTRHIDASLYVSRSTGKYNLKLIRKDYVVEELLVLDKTNVSSISNPNRVTFGEFSNSVTVKFWNWKTQNEDSVTVSDTALARIQDGNLIDSSVNYPGFTTKRNAVIAATRDLRSLSSGTFSCTVIANSEAENLNIGSAVILNWPEWELDNVVMRVTGISFGDGINNKIRINLSEDVYSTSSDIEVDDSGTDWVDPSQPPQVIENQISLEIPYYEAVQNYGQTNVDNVISTNSAVGYIASAASRPSGAFNARMWVNSGTEYTESAILDYCPFGILNENISHTQTTFSLINFIDLGNIEIGSYAQIDNGDSAEFIRVDSIDILSGSITCGRGCLDTTPKKHFIGDQIFFLDQYLAADQTEYASGENIDVKLTSISGQGELSIDLATEMSITLNTRAFRPYPPGSFMINSEYYPEGPLDGVLTLSWVGRDRLQQTSGEIYDHTFGNIGPESGTTYRVRCYVDDVLDDTVNPATSGMTFTPSSEGLVRIEVHSLRDGFYSYQPASHEFYYITSSYRTTQDEITIETQDGDIRVTED